MVTSKAAREASGSGDIVTQTGFEAVLNNLPQRRCPCLHMSEWQSGAAYGIQEPDGGLMGPR